VVFRAGHRLPLADGHATEYRPAEFDAVVDGRVQSPRERLVQGNVGDGQVLFELEV
jgi:hypothetical protein